MQWKDLQFLFTGVLVLCFGFIVMMSFMSRSMLEDYIVFMPPTHSNYDPQCIKPFQVVNIPYLDGFQTRVLVSPEPNVTYCKDQHAQRCPPMVLFFHGNASNAVQTVHHLQEKGYFSHWPLYLYQWVCLEYEGYCDNSSTQHHLSRPSMSYYYRSCVHAIQYLLSRRQPSQIILIGESIGTHAVTQTLLDPSIQELCFNPVYRTVPLELVLVNPFRSFYHAADVNPYIPAWFARGMLTLSGVRENDMNVEHNLQRIASAYPICSGSTLRNAETRLFFFCSEMDGLFPPEVHGKCMYGSFKHQFDSVRFFFMEEGTHNTYRLPAKQQSRTERKPKLKR